MSIDPSPGERLYDQLRELYPLPRSITGEGVRQTLARLGREVPLDITEVPTGSPALDWVVPKEWVVRQAWLAGPDGRRLVDFAEHPLHLLGYSIPIHARLSLQELRPHLYTMPDRPDWIPYRTSYYQENWGFCLPDRLARDLPEGEYEVFIDTDLIDGSLTYGELLVPGAEAAEVLISTHTCHPAMANDNTSGIVLAGALAAWVRQAPRRYSYRFLFIPGTIGSLTWLERNAEAVDRIRHGLVLTGLGDSGGFAYKRSRRGDAVVDRAVAQVLHDKGCPHRLVDFSPYGYDERQFCSPGYNLPVGRIGRAHHGEYPEYHTSADNLSFVSAEALGESFEVLKEVIDVIERDRVYVNLNPRGEPQLGRRGLYRALGATIDSKAAELALLWVLNLADGQHSLLDMAQRSGTSFAEIAQAADLLEKADLLAPA